MRPFGTPGLSAPGTDTLDAVTRAATPAIAALIAAGVAHEVLTYHHDARAQSYGEEAVAALAGPSALATVLLFSSNSTMSFGVTMPGGR